MQIIHEKYILPCPGTNTRRYKMVLGHIKKGSFVAPNVDEETTLTFELMVAY